jgi:hypothetical protein
MEVVYLASRYSRADEMQGVRDVLRGLGVKVASRWIDRHPDTNGPHWLEKSFTPEELSRDPQTCGKYALADVEDVMAADTVISFTCGTGGKGGRHIEFGMGYSAGKRMIVVGPRENVFHTLPGVEWHPDWPHFVMALTEERGFA